MSSEDVEVRRSRRRRRTVSAYRDGARTVVLIPASFSAAEEARWVERMLARLTAGERRRQSSDAALAARAEQLSRRYLGGHARPTSVRWVSTMGRRWASCTPAEGTIRVSDRLRDVPDHVLDYVLLHELAHLLVPGHGPSSGACSRPTRAWSGPGASSTGWPTPRGCHPRTTATSDAVDGDSVGRRAGQPRPRASPGE